MRTAVQKCLLDARMSSSDMFPSGCFYLFFWHVAAHVKETFSFMPIQNDLRDERKHFQHLCFFHSELADFCLGMELRWGPLETKPGLPMWKWLPAVAPLLINRNMLRLENLSPREGGGGSAKRGSLTTTRSPPPWLVFIYIFSWLMGLRGRHACLSAYRQSCGNGCCLNK